MAISLLGIEWYFFVTPVLVLIVSIAILGLRKRSKRKVLDQRILRAAHSRLSGDIVAQCAAHGSVPPVPSNAIGILLPPQIQEHVLCESVEEQTFLAGIVAAGVEGLTREFADVETNKDVAKLPEHWQKVAKPCATTNCVNLAGPNELMHANVIGEDEFQIIGCARPQNDRGKEDFRQMIASRKVNCILHLCNQESLLLSSIKDGVQGNGSENQKPSPPEERTIYGTSVLCVTQSVRNGEIVTQLRDYVWPNWNPEQGLPRGEALVVLAELWAASGGAPMVMESADGVCGAAPLILLARLAARLRRGLAVNRVAEARLVRMAGIGALPLNQYVWACREIFNSYQSRRNRPAILEREKFLDECDAFLSRER